MHVDVGLDSFQDRGSTPLTSILYPPYYIGDSPFKGLTEWGILSLSPSSKLAPENERKRENETRNLSNQIPPGPSKWELTSYPGGKRSRSLHDSQVDEEKAGASH